MKILILTLLLSTINVFAGAQSWEIVRAVSEQVSDQRIKITVTIKNIGSKDQIVPSAIAEGREDMALANSYLWARDATIKEALKPIVSHYYTQNGRSCHGIHKSLTISANGEVSFIMHDVIASVGKRLLLVFGEGIHSNIIGDFTVLNP